MTEMRSSFLAEIRRRLGPENLALLAGETSAFDGDRWELRFDDWVRRASELQDRVARNRRLAAGLEDLDRVPRGRQVTLLRNSPPQLLLAVTYDLLRRSFALRFHEIGRSLELAELANEAAGFLERSGELSDEAMADLWAEAWIYLANARRVNSDFAGSERAFLEGRRWMEKGTGDLKIRAEYLRLLGCQRFGQGLIDEAIELVERQIRLHRRLNEPRALSNALIDRGILGAWTEPVDKVCAFLREGAELAGDQYDRLFQGLIGLAERLARDGEGFQAWQALCSAGVLTPLVSNDELRMQRRWVEGLALRAMGQLDAARTRLEEVRAAYLERGWRRHGAAIASLDLAAVLAEQGRVCEVRELAEEAYACFRAAGLEKRALAAVQVLRDAARAESLTEGLAARVADFLIRHRYDPELRFDGA